MPSQKIALIANGIDATDPEALENILRKNGLAVDIFDVRRVQPAGDGFEILTDDGLQKIDPDGYAAVARIIKGGMPGDTEKSWALQKFFEEHGAKPHVGIDAARKITERILCRQVLTEKSVPCFPAVTVGKDEPIPTAIQTQIEALGQPPYVVRKSLGSGKDSLVIADSTEEAIGAMGHYHHPAEANAVPSGAMVHTLPPKLDADLVERYRLDEITEADKRSYQFRFILVDGKLFGANIGYAEPGKFALNPAQGVTFKAIDPASIDPDIAKLAVKAAAAHGLRIAAVDIALDAEAHPRVLDMNASPDLSFTNDRGEPLKEAVAHSIQKMTETKRQRTERAEPNCSGAGPEKETRLRR